MTQLDLTDIQGNILKGYRMPVARYTFLHVTDVDGGRRLVGDIAREVTTAEPWPEGRDTKVQKPDSTVNIALTHSGLRAVGVPARSLASFPVSFQEGMKARAGILGDTGSSAPEHWDDIWQAGKVHIWVSINAASEAHLQRRYRWLRDLVDQTDGVSILGEANGAPGTQDAYKLGDGKEHFGYRDGISNPDVAGSQIPKMTRIGKLRADGSWAPIATGEFLLGHPDEADEMPQAPSPPLLARNGTYMVYRKLHENVALFRKFLAVEGNKYAGGTELLAAKLVGRWRDGTPLALSPEKMDPAQILNNDFTYADDPDGVMCPIGSHIRRSNPRDALGFGGKLANRHRIIRRGLPYGKPAAEGEPVSDDESRGVIFMAINASIERQFEFVQREWLNFGNEFRQGNDKDPIAGDQDGTGKMVIPGTGESDRSQPHVCFGLQRFVETRGGDYFFIPSMTALRKIAAGSLDETRPPQPARPAMSFLEQLELLLTSGARIPAQDPDFRNALLFTMKSKSDELFALLRAHRPIFLAGPFALVTRFDDVQEVLSRDTVFHVPYEAKMKALLNDEASHGDANFFLGMANTARYQRDSSNMRLAARREDVADRLVAYVHETAERIVANAAGRLDAVHDLTRVVPAHFVREYFGTPWKDERDLIRLASTMFQFLFIDLLNDPALGEAARAAGKETRDHLDDIIRRRKRTSKRGDKEDVLERCLEMQDAQLPGMDDATIRNNLLGLIVGAVPTTSKAAALALNYLLDLPGDKLAAAQRAARDNDDALLARYVFEALRFRPHNPGVFRITLQDYVVARDQPRAAKIPQGTIVLAATQSAMFDESELDQPDQFRIDRPAYHYMHNGYSLHTCFGEHINAVQIPGILKPLLQRQNLRRAAGDAGQLRWDSPLPSSRTKEFPSSLTVEWDV